MLEIAIAFVLSYIWHMFGVTIGYHRLISHRSFTCPKLVEYFWVLAGYLALEGSPAWWAVMHRAHHRHTDTPLDPHSPRYGLFEAYFGWTTHGKYPAHIDPVVQCKDLLKDPVYRFLEAGGNWYVAFSLNVFFGLAFRAALWYCFGWQIALGRLLSIVAVNQVPLFLNVFCHIPKLGYQNFATGDDSVNVWWVALLTMGEGWHNNHHAFPGSARSGIKPAEIDPAWMVVRSMKTVGLVSWMNEPKVKKLPSRPLTVARAKRYLANRIERHRPLTLPVQLKAPAMAGAGVSLQAD